jgi:hypothetical protein
MRTVAVGSDRQVRLLMPLPLVFTYGFLPRAVVNGFFFAPMTTVLHTKVSAPDCGSVEAKRFSLTQGERLHEGCAPSDKQTSRLMNCCRDRISGLINKAAQHNKGQTPLWTPNRVKVGMCLTLDLIIIPIVALVLPKGIQP